MVSDTPWTWAVALGGIIAFDVWLIAGDHPSLSQWAGLHPVIAGCGCALLCLHFNTHRLGLSRFDPLSAMSRRIRGGRLNRGRP